MDTNTDSPESYLNDLKEIKYMLGKFEEKPILEPWAFFTWAVFIALGTVISWIVHSIRPLSPFDAFFMIWLPVMITGGLFEGIAFLSRFKKDAVPINTKSFVKTMIFMIGFFFVATLVIYSLLTTNAPLPGILLAFLACAFFLIGYLSYFSLFYSALGMFIISVPFLLAGWTSDTAYFACGVLSSLYFAIGGIQYLVAGKKRHE